MKFHTPKVLGLGLLLLAQSALADFSGPYDVTQWTKPQSFVCGGGTVNTAGAPASVVISITGCASLIQGFQHNGAPSNGTISFSYSGYSIANTTAAYDVGAASTPFPATASGTITVPIQTGQKLQITLTNQSGTPAALTISNFTFAPPAAATPASIPTLSEWALIGLSSILALFGLAGIRRRQG